MLRVLELGPVLPWKECGECRFCAADNENRRLVAQVSMAQNMPLFPNSLNSPTGDPQIQIMVPNEDLVHGKL